jgi:hypothetical protein
VFRRLGRHLLGLLILLVVLSLGLHMSTGWLHQRMGPAFIPAPPSPHASALGQGLGAVAGTILGAVLAACFITGLGARLILWFRRAVSGVEGGPSRSPRQVGREWADDVPLPGRRHRGRGEPPHPLFRGGR